MPTKPPAFFAVKNIEKYQHYKFRNPIWVKLHRDFLTDYDLRQLSPEVRLSYLGCLILGSETGNRIPNDPAYLSQRMGFTITQNTLSPLFRSGHLLALRDSAKRRVHGGSETELILSSELIQITETELSEVPVLAPASTETPTRQGVEGVEAPWERFAVTDVHRTWCRDHGLPNPDQHLEQFQDHYRTTGGRLRGGQGGLVKDWNAAFRNWMQNVPKFSGEQKKGGIERR